MTEPDFVGSDRSDRSRIEVAIFLASGCRISETMRARVRETVDVQSVDIREIDVWADPQSGVDRDVLTVPTVVVSQGSDELVRIVGCASRRRVLKKLRAVTANRDRISAIPGAIAIST